jgi:hypothetical protein
VVSDLLELPVEKKKGQAQATRVEIAVGGQQAVQSYDSQQMWLRSATEI